MMERDDTDEDINDFMSDEETLIREGDDLMRICHQIYSHTPQTSEYSFDCKPTRKGYAASLEKVVHMLKLYLELLLQFIGLSPKVICAFSKHRGVHTPDLSLPALAYTVWSRIKFLTADSITTELNTISEESDRGSTSAETQTLVLSLDSCESCYLSQDLVKHLVSKVELFCQVHEVTESSILSVKHQLCSKVHDMTNWEAMTEWCKALTTDIEQLIEITDKLLTNWRKERAKEKKRYEELENKLKAAEGKPNPEEKKRDNSETSSKFVQEDCANLKTALEPEKGKVNLQLSEKASDVNDIIRKYEMKILRFNKIVEELENKSRSKEIVLAEQQKKLEILERQINKCKQNELMEQEKFENSEKILTYFKCQEEDSKNLPKGLNDRIKEEVFLKAKIVQLEQEMSILGEECKFLKHELQKYDPSFKLLAKNQTTDVETSDKETFKS